MSLGVGQHRRHRPLDPILDPKRDTAQIARLHLGQTDVDDAQPVLASAVDEVGGPTILATFTVIAALLPMGFVSGLMGPYMRPIPVLGSSAMFFSLVAAFIFTPWFAVRMRPASLSAFRKAEAREQRTHEFIGKIYEPIIRPLINHRSLGILFLVSIIGITAAVCSLFYFQVVAVKMLPFDNKNELLLVINYDEGTTLERGDALVREMESFLHTVPEVTDYTSYVGVASPMEENW